MMRRLESLNALFGTDSKRNTAAKQLARMGMLHHNGLPTAQQISQGNFKVEYYRAVNGHSGRVKARVYVTDAGYSLITKRIIKH